MTFFKNILICSLLTIILFLPSHGFTNEYDGISFDVVVDSPGKKGVEACFYFFDKFSEKWIVAGWYFFENGQSKAFVDTKYHVVGYVGTSGKYFYSSNLLEHDVLYHEVSKEKLTVPVGTKIQDRHAQELGFIIAPMKQGRGSMRFTKEFMYEQKEKDYELIQE